MPQLYALENGARLLFPKDPDAGGSWIALKSNNDAAVLLNGAFVAYQHTPLYCRSRGLVLIDIISAMHALHSFHGADLDAVAPFTLILFLSGRLYECRWSGSEKFCTELNAKDAHIWSSVTLYDAAATAMREQWFRDFLEAHPFPCQQQILHFHRCGGVGNAGIDLCMNRNGETKTVSITSLLLSSLGASLTYLDLERKTKHTESFIHAAQTEAAYVQ